MGVNMKFGLIGLGRMGADPSYYLSSIMPQGWIPKSHLETMLRITSCNNIAICDTNNDLLQTRMDQYNISVGFRDYKELIHNFQPSFLSIATRTEERVNIVNYAINLGIPIIFFEKPISRSINDCENIILAAQKKEITLGYGVNRRYIPIYRFVRDLIWSGNLGDIIEIFSAISKVSCGRYFA